MVSESECGGLAGWLFSTVDTILLLNEQLHPATRNKIAAKRETEFFICDRFIGKDTCKITYSLPKSWEADQFNADFPALIRKGMTDCGAGIKISLNRQKC